MPFVLTLGRANPSATPRMEVKVGTRRGAVNSRQFLAWAISDHQQCGQSFFGIAFRTAFPSKIDTLNSTDDALCSFTRLGTRLRNQEPTLSNVTLEPPSCNCFCAVTNELRFARSRAP